MFLCVCFLLLWVLIFPGSVLIYMKIFGTKPPIPDSCAMPFACVWMASAIPAAAYLAYRFNRHRLLRCPHCNAILSEYRGSVDPLCHKCGQSVI